MPKYEVGRITRLYDTTIIEAETPEDAVEFAQSEDEQGRDLFLYASSDNEYLLLAEDVEGDATASVVYLDIGA